MFRGASSVATPRALLWYRGDWGVHPARVRGGECSGAPAVGRLGGVAKWGGLRMGTRGLSK